MSSENYFGKLSEKLLSQDGMSYSEVIDYTPLNIDTRDPEDSDLDWDFYSKSKNSRLLKRYPPKLLDRAAETAASNLDVEKELQLGEKYLKVESGHGNCRFTVENKYGAAGVEAYELDSTIEFTEYLADEREDIDFEGQPERAASSSIPEEVEFEDFFEDIEIKRDIILIKPDQ